MSQAHPVVQLQWSVNVRAARALASGKAATPKGCSELGSAFHPFLHFVASLGFIAPCKWFRFCSVARLRSRLFFNRFLFPYLFKISKRCPDLPQKKYRCPFQAIFARLGASSVISCPTHEYMQRSCYLKVSKRRNRQIHKEKQGQRGGKPLEHVNTNVLPYK